MPLLKFELHALVRLRHYLGELALTLDDILEFVRGQLDLAK